ncbi:Gp15 family bacteriophage protein [Proteiniclasticum sp. QWL-01]|nr:Gp15 family bacteriophage protein [Proteiniclasticum sp. QWL-01]WFF72671.1 Gp15 family bacteriophage protein [Proteiniclasticum sp. QWL-01]
MRSFLRPSRQPSRISLWKRWRQKRLKQDFVPRWYDIWDDWELIEASFADQYHIRLRSAQEESMSWEEFKNLLSGLGPETALGRVINIRSEDQKDTLRHFSEGQHKIRDDWRKKEERRRDDFNRKNQDQKAVDPYAALSAMFQGLLK